MSYSTSYLDSMYRLKTKREDYINEMASRAGNAPELYDCLDDREVFIIFHFYGFGNPEFKTLEAIGNEFGVSRQRIAFIKNRAVSKLKNQF